MCCSRNKYHYDVRKLRQFPDHIKEGELLDVSEAGDISLMKDMKEGEALFMVNQVDVG